MIITYYNKYCKYKIIVIIIVYYTGPLSSVGGLSYSFINSSTVDITWSPPFTLPGTNIIGYNISVATNTSTVEAFTPNNYIEITVSTCIETIITVTGYNGLDGESSTILIGNISVTLSTIVLHCFCWHKGNFFL